MTTLHALNKRLKKLEAAAPVDSEIRRVFLIGPDGASAEQLAEVDEARRAGYAVEFIEMVPGERQ